MSSHDRHRREGKSAGAGKTQPEQAPSSRVAPRSGGPAPRVQSGDLLSNGMPLIIEHAGREYRLRVTSNGKLILTA